MDTPTGRKPDYCAVNIFLLSLLFLMSPAHADEQAARDLIDRMEQLYRGESSDATITMVVETPQYRRELKMTGQTMGRELAFFRILAPRKDRGVTTLKRDQEMWNYFPKINKVIKVPPSMMMVRPVT